VTELGRLVDLDHVQVAIPVGGEEAARRFYGDLLGLREVAKPASPAGRGGCWFVGPGVAITLASRSRSCPRARPIRRSSWTI